MPDEGPGFATWGSHLTSQTEALATQRIDALMNGFKLSWGALK